MAWKHALIWIHRSTQYVGKTIVLVIAALCFFVPLMTGPFLAQDHESHGSGKKHDSHHCGEFGD